MKLNTKQIALLDICTSDYFTGYHLPVLQIALYGKVTNVQMSSAIMSELDAMFDYINPNDDAEITKLYEDYCNELNAKGGEIFFEDKEYNEDEDNDFDDCAYAYFSIIQPQIVNGITFLN